MRKIAAASAFFAFMMAGMISTPAPAASSAWQRNEGASVRLVTAGPPAADGTLRGVLEIDLEPGWKTYWRDPGSNGVPPSLDVSGSSGWTQATLLFPAPERHDDGYGAWAGYSGPVTLPVRLEPKAGGAWGLIEAEAFLGVCRDICIPFPAKLSLDPRAGDAPEDRTLVDEAFAALPAVADADFGVSVLQRTVDTLVLDAKVPAGAIAEPELFLAGENGFSFGVPAAERSGDGWRFTVPILDGPAGGEAFYTLRSGARAVAGTVTLP